MKSTLLFLLAGVLGVALGFGTLKAKDRVSEILDRPRFAVVNLNSVVKANEVRILSEGKTETRFFLKPNVSPKDSKKNLPF